MYLKNTYLNKYYHSYKTNELKTRIKRKTYNSYGSDGITRYEFVKIIYRNLKTIIICILN